MLKSSPESIQFAKELAALSVDQDKISQAEQLFLQHSPDLYWYEPEKCWYNRPSFYSIVGYENGIESKVMDLYLKYVPKVASGMEKAYEDYKKNVHSFLSSWKTRLSTITPKDFKKATMEPLIYELNGYLNEKYHFNIGVSAEDRVTQDAEDEEDEEDEENEEDEDEELSEAEREKRRYQKEDEEKPEDLKPCVSLYYLEGPDYDYPEALMAELDEILSIWYKKDFSDAFSRDGVAPLEKDDDYRGSRTVVLAVHKLPNLKD